MSRSLSLPLFLLGLFIVRTGVAMPINPRDLRPYTLYIDTAPSTGNSNNDSLLLVSPPTANIKGMKRVSLTTTPKGEAFADQNSSHTSSAEYVQEDGDLSLSEMREILRKEQQLIRKRRSSRISHIRNRHGRRGRGSRNSKGWGRGRGYGHSKEHRWRKGSRKSKGKLYYQCPRWWWWGHKHSSSEEEGWLPSLWTTFPRPIPTLPTHATSRSTPDTTTLGTTSLTSTVTSSTSLTTHTQSASTITKPTTITKTDPTTRPVNTSLTTPYPPVMTHTTSSTSQRPTATTLPMTNTPTMTPKDSPSAATEPASTMSSAVTSGYTFPDGRPLTLEADAETLSPRV